MAQRALRIAALAAALAVVACTGDAPLTMPPSADAAASDAAPDGDAAADAGGDDEGLGTGTAFAELYADFFAPGARASCSGASCHGSAEAPGANASGFVCPDEATCLTTMTGASGLVRTSDRAAPKDAHLVDVLRHLDGDGAVVGFMPKAPAYVFSRRSMDRIEAWIGRGAPAR